jgi:hypothetical protein
VLPDEGSEKMLVHLLLFSPVVPLRLLLLLPTVRSFAVLKRND